MLSDTAHEILMHQLDGLCKQHGIGYDDLLSEQARTMQKQADGLTDPLVKACVSCAAEYLRRASMDYYASFK